MIVMMDPNPSCEQCDDNGFVILVDADGPGLHDEDNCPCTRGTCDCQACEGTPHSARLAA